MLQMIWNIVNIIGWIISIQLYTMALVPAINILIVRKISYAWSLKLQFSPWTERFFKYACCVPYAVFMSIPEYQRKMKLKAYAHRLWSIQAYVLCLSLMIIGWAHYYNSNQIDVMGTLGVLWMLMLHRPDDDNDRRDDDEEYPDVPDDPEDHTVDVSWGGMADSYIRSLQHKVVTHKGE